MEPPQLSSSCRVRIPQGIAPRSLPVLASFVFGIAFIALLGDAWSADPTAVGDRESNAQRVRDSLRQQFHELFKSMSDEAKRGYRHLTESVYLPADFDEEVLADLDQLVHRPPYRDVPESVEGRAATWLAFGLTPRPDNRELPLQYVVTPKGDYVMNCFACHGGSVYGEVYPGAPNNAYALESLTEAVRATKLKQRKPLGHMDVGSMFMPLGTSNGTSNAVMFGVALMNYRDADLGIHPERLPAAMTHHDMDAPAWWNFSKKSHIYIDGFAEKGHKGLMQFMLVRQNGPQKFREWESDFRAVYAFLSELRPPKYPLEIDGHKANRGRALFERNCSQCHGTYAEQSSSHVVLTTGEAHYPEITVPIEDIGTDDVRWKALTPKNRRHYGSSWFADYGKQETRVEVEGYVAPPLDGIWASAPYFHNGSVPTLRHVLRSSERPTRWQRIAVAMDTESVGLTVDSDPIASADQTAAERRWIFDATQPGKSNAGHTFGDQLTDEECDAVLEYLKTL